MRHTQYGLLQYDITDIESVNSQRGRVYVRIAGAFDMKHGKNCRHPKGQHRPCRAD